MVNLLSTGNPVTKLADASFSFTHPSWKLGDLVHVEHEGLDGYLPISEDGLIYTLHHEGDSDYPVGILLRSGRIIRTPYQTDKLTFVRSTSCSYQFQSIGQLLENYKAGRFAAFF